MISVDIIGDKAIKIKLQRLTGRDMEQILYRSLNKESRSMTNYIQNSVLTGGTTSNRLKVRSGHLRKTTHSVLPFKEKGYIVGGTSFGTKYAGTHIGRRGTSKIIRPKGQWLTVPLKPALTPAGVMKFPKAKDYSGLFFVKSKKGNLLLAQANKEGGLTPFFVLKKQIKVKARIHPKVILKSRTKSIKKTIKIELDRVINSTN